MPSQTVKPPDKMDSSASTIGTCQHAGCNSSLPANARTNRKYCDAHSGYAKAKLQSASQRQNPPDITPAAAAADPHPFLFRSDNGTECPVCHKTDVKGMKQHMNCCHPELRRLKLIEKAPNAVPKRRKQDEEKLQLAEQQRRLQQQFFSKFNTFLQAVKDGADRNDDDFEKQWSLFEDNYTEWIGALLKLQPCFYRKAKKSGAKRSRRSIEEVDAARETFKYKEAQFNYYNDIRKLQRQIYEPDEDDAKFASNELFEYYSNVYGAENNNVAPLSLMPHACTADEASDLNEVISDADAGITGTEVLEVMRGISNKVSAGTDGLRIKTLRVYDNEAKLMSLIFSICFATKRVPKGWLTGSTVILKKPRKDSSLLDNRRPITIVSIVRRIYCRVITGRLGGFIDAHPAQKGFQPGPGLIENTLLARQLITHSNVYHQPLYMVLFDVKKAFDSVGHLQVFAALERAGVPANVADVIKSLYAGFSTKVRFKSATTREIEVHRGVLQGCPCSPALFNASIDFAIRYLHKESGDLGYSVDADCKVVMCAFADDLMIAADSHANATKLCTTVIELLKTIGLDINLAKCSALIINDTEQNISEFCTSCPVRPVDEEEMVRYLGVDLSTHDKPCFDELGAKIAHECDAILKYKYLRFRQKLSIFETTTPCKLVFPAQAYCLGYGPINNRRSLLQHDTIKEIVKVLWRTQIELVGLYEQTPRNFLRGAAAGRCLALRDPVWVIANNSAVAAGRMQHSSDERWRAVAKSTAVNFAGIISSHIDAALKVLDTTTAAARVLVSAAAPDAGAAVDEPDDAADISRRTSEAMHSIIGDEKKLKCQRLTIKLREAAADCWQRSTSGRQAGAHLTGQVLKANDWRRVFSRSSDGSLMVAFKLLGNQHSLRTKGFLHRSQDDATCRMCKIPGQRETLQHVVGGMCSQMNKLACARHDLVVKKVCQLIDFPICDETQSEHWVARPGVEFDRSLDHYKPDMLAVSADRKRCVILDPTIGFETSDEMVAAAIAEKSRRYLPLIPIIKRSGFEEVTVQGLWFGARGMLHEPTIQFLATTFGIPIERLLPLAETVMNYSGYMYQRVVST